MDISFRDGQYQDNLQEQRDEVLALSSIFNTEDDEKLKLLSEVSEENNGLFTLLVTVAPKPSGESIHVDLAVAAEQDEMEMAAAAAPPEPPAPPNLGSSVQFCRSESGQRWQGSINVKYLSPLHLMVTFPATYPSSAPPHYYLSCGWLTSVQLTALSQQLENLWKEAYHSPIVFTWVDWLENETLSYLGITDHIVLRPQGQTESKDADEKTENFVPWEEDIGEVIAAMIRYNREQLDIEFCQTTHECQVCYDEKLGVQFFRMSDCPHHFCHPCMAAFCDMHVRDGTVEALKCPDTDCNSLIPPYIVQAVMGPDAYARWEALLLQKTLDSMTDTVYCPRCNSLVITDEDEKLCLAHCPTCYFAFCTECQQGWHQGRGCKTDEEMLQEVQQRNRNGLSPAEARKFDELLRKVEEEIQSKQSLKRSTLNCPSCKVPVEKIGGCNKMTCKCGKCFCWVCGKSIEGYAHFRTGSCALFPGQTTPAVVGLIRRPAEGALRIQARLEVNPQLANNRCQCPMCKQVNLKGEDKNNHIKCWNCKTNFCFSCRQRIMGNVNSHFIGPCVQHS